MAEIKGETYRELEKEWKATCRIVLGGEVGSLDEYREWLCGLNDKLTLRKAVNGQTVAMTSDAYCAGSTADYIMQNPSTNLSFVSNTSTGRGQVTNELVSIFLGIGKDIEFEKVKQDSSDVISRQGGDVATLTFASQGEMLLRYVLMGEQRQ